MTEARPRVARCSRPAAVREEPHVSLAHQHDMHGVLVQEMHKMHMGYKRGACWCML